jgi:hypothetical protein
MFFLATALWAALFVAFVLARARVAMASRFTFQTYCCAALASALVYSAGPVQDRFLVGGGIGTAIALAYVIAGPLRESGRATESGSAFLAIVDIWRSRPDFIVRGLIVVHLVLAPIVLPVRAWSHRNFAHVQNEPAWSLAAAYGKSPPEHLILLTHPGPLRGLGSVMILRATGVPTPAKTTSLVVGHERMVVQRRKDETLCVQTIRQDWDSVEVRAVKQHDHSQQRPRKFVRDGIRISVDTLKDKEFQELCARWPSKAALEAAFYVVWTDAGYEAFDVPVPGQEAIINATSSILKPLNEAQKIDSE